MNAQELIAKLEATEARAQLEMDHSEALKIEIADLREGNQRLQNRISELEAERDRLLSPYCEHCRSLLLPTINCCPLCAQLQERIGTALAGAAETERKLEADVERLRTALHEVEKEECPMGIDWGDSKAFRIAHEALADTQGQG